MPVYAHVNRLIQVTLAAAAAALAVAVFLFGIYPAGAAPQTPTYGHVHYVNPAVDDGLVGYWRLNAITATVAVDVSLNRNHGTAVGGVSWTSETPYAIDVDNPGAVSLDGVDDGIVIPDQNNIDFDTGQDFTIALWVNIPQADQPDLGNIDNDIVEKWSGSGPYPYVIRFINSGPDKGKITAGRFDGSNNPTVISAQGLNDGVYYHIAFVRRSGTLHLYVDGVEEDSAPDTTVGSTSNSSDLFIGRRGNNINHFNGLIDELRIYNRPLSGDEIISLAFGGEHDGESWDDPFTTLERALGAAEEGEEIWVIQGIYTPTNGVGQNASFTLRDGVALYGGFDGSESDRSDRDWVNHVTILSGDIEGNDVTAGGVVTDPAHIVGANVYHVLQGEGVARSAIVDGFTVTAGQAISASQPDGGGGLFLNGSPTISLMTFRGNQAANGGGLAAVDGNPLIKDSQFVDNHAAANGGGLSLAGGRATFLNGTIQDNEAGGSGGGLYVDSSNPLLIGVTIDNNVADQGGGVSVNSSGMILLAGTIQNNQATNFGGGLYLDGIVSTIPLLDGTLINNNSANRGGGLYISGGSPLLNGVSVRNNDAVQGGGLYAAAASPTMEQALIQNNTAQQSGGGLLADKGQPTLLASRFYGNTAADGGGMANVSSNSILINVLFSGNAAADRGGALANFSSAPTLDYVTLSGNTAGSSGGAFFNDGSAMTLENSIAWGNSAPTGGEIFNQNGSTPAISHSLVGPTGTTGTGNIGAAASPFVSDPDPGLDATWGTTDDNFGILWLGAGSPAVNAGSNALHPAGTDFDIAGNPRIQNGTVDMGAYERNALFLPIVANR